MGVILGRTSTRLKRQGKAIRYHTYLVIRCQRDSQSPLEDLFYKIGSCKCTTRKLALKGFQQCISNQSHCQTYSVIAKTKGRKM